MRRGRPRRRGPVLPPGGGSASSMVRHLSSRPDRLNWGLRRQHSVALSSWLETSANTVNNGGNNYYKQLGNSVRLRHSDLYYNIQTKKTKRGKIQWISLAWVIAIFENNNTILTYII